MKCYLANTGSGHFITSDEAATGEPGSLTCPSCGCVLYVQPGSADEKPWFWHDQSTVPVSTLMGCVHSDPEIKLRKLRNSIGELTTHVTAMSWYCVWCGQHY
nr:zinc-ribbon domain-containing protein [Pantoea sp. Ap-870]